MHLTRRLLTTPSPPVVTATTTTTVHPARHRRAHKHRSMNNTEPSPTGSKTSAWSKSSSTTLINNLNQQPLNIANTTPPTTTTTNTRFNVPAECADPFALLQRMLLPTPVVIIMRGLPGSGKSYIAQRIAHYYTAQHTTPKPDHNNQQQQAANSVCHMASADNYFVDPVTGTYNYDFNKLAEAHAYCMQQFVNAVENNIPVVIVDNTNMSRWNYDAYIQLIQTPSPTRQLYSLQIVDVTMDNIQRYSHGVVNDMDVCLFRNKHTVPLEVLMSMRQRYEVDKRAVVVPAYMTNDILRDVLLFKRQQQAVGGGVYVQSVAVTKPSNTQPLPASFIVTPSVN